VRMKPAIESMEANSSLSRQILEISLLLVAGGGR
jgi:hypothetical protein